MSFFYKQNHFNKRHYLYFKLITFTLTTNNILKLQGKEGNELFRKIERDNGYEPWIKSVDDYLKSARMIQKIEIF